MLSSTDYDGINALLPTYHNVNLFHRCYVCPFFIYVGIDQIWYHVKGKINFLNVSQPDML